MGPADAAAPAPSRPAVLDLSPLAAAGQVAPEKPCPVCGAWLEKATASGATAGLPGAPQPAARCASCSFHSGPLASWGTVATRILVFLFLAALAGKLGFLFLHREGQQLWGLLLLLAAPLPAVLAFFDARLPRRKVAARIASARARFTREKEEDFKIDPALLLAAARPGAPCPVCEKEKLTGPAANALWSRGNLRCPRCRLDVPMTLTETGFVAAFAIAGVLVIGGALLVRHGLQFGGNTMMYLALIGVGIAAAGVYVGMLVQGAGDELALKELERQKRRHERRKRGLAVMDAEDEPALWFQENLEAVVVAVILALIIRHFVMEAFVIPTGSMAPTLLGDHFTAKCANCGYSFAVAKREGDIGHDGVRVDYRCPLCGTEGDQNSKNFFPGDVQGGNKILVNKFLYKLEPPERWNVIVFKYPKDPLSKNFIKRLVGLPGETITVDARGDVWAKKDKDSPSLLQRKPRGVQEELWMPVYDSRFPDPRLEAWKAESDPARWVMDRGAGAPETFTVKPGAGEACLHYTKDIYDSYGYNPSGQGSSGRNKVGDLQVRATVVPDKDCKAIRLSTVENERVLTAEIPVGTGDVAVLASNTMDHEILRKKCAPLRAGSSNEISLGYADERLTLVVNGAVVFEWDDPLSPNGTITSSVRIAAVGPGGARFDQVKVFRDLVYTSTGSYDPSNRPLEVPKDCYFVMGDNSPNSQDGRVFGFVHEPHLIGRAFLVFWPLFEVKLIR